MFHLFSFSSAIAEDLNCRVCVTREKKAILDCLEDPALEKRLTLDPRQAKVHVLPMRQLNYQVTTPMITAS